MNISKRKKNVTPNVDNTYHATLCVRRELTMLSSSATDACQNEALPNATTKKNK